MNERTDIMKREKSIPESSRKISTVAPLVDIYENEDEILLYADMPGVEKKDISVGIDNGRLSLGAVRKLESAGTVQWEEFGDVELKRTFSVPQTIDVNKVSAELKNGVLHLHLPKSEAAKPRQIEIKAT